ncbi:MAG: hypothetical protein CM1200mP2_50940 [Planctomycetaceae bacterium]|nr:MAG: hypothetical protein CM1200mP2_50940 [Planctomycetaceae bacterium]
MSSADEPQEFPLDDMLRMLEGVSPPMHPSPDDFVPHGESREHPMPTPEDLQVTVRSYHPDDLEVIKRITVEAFSGVSIDEAAELVYGTINGHDWKWRKARHIDADVARDVEGILVVESADGEFGGFTSPPGRFVDGGIGYIPNLAFFSRVAWTRPGSAADPDGTRPVPRGGGCLMRRSRHWPRMRLATISTPRSVFARGARRGPFLRRSLGFPNPPRTPARAIDGVSKVVGATGQLGSKVAARCGVIGPWG